jgi:TPR repeat protein
MDGRIFDDAARMKRDVTNGTTRVDDRPYIDWAVGPTVSAEAGFTDPERYEPDRPRSSFANAQARCRTTSELLPPGLVASVQGNDVTFGATSGPVPVTQFCANGPATVSISRFSATGSGLIGIKAALFRTGINHVGDDRGEHLEENLRCCQTYFGSDAFRRWASFGWLLVSRTKGQNGASKVPNSMLAKKHIAFVFLVGAAAVWPTGRIGALEGTDAVAAANLPASDFAAPRAVVRAGLEAGRADPRSPELRDSAIEALKLAADRGDTVALWRLGNAYAAGDGVPHDDLKAYRYFARIIAGYDEDSPSRRDRAIVSSAFVAIGTYSLNGIENSDVRPNPSLALQMFRTAATAFADANAQYNLARMYLEGVGIGKDSRQAARWLRLAADKGHLQAQAQLGRILFSGQESLKADRPLGLMWLTLARESAIDSKQDQWVIDLYDKAMASANDSDRQVALVYLEDHLKRRN